MRHDMQTQHRGKYATLLMQGWCLLAGSGLIGAYLMKLQASRMEDIMPLLILCGAGVASWLGGALVHTVARCLGDARPASDLAIALVTQGRKQPRTQEDIRQVFHLVSERVTL